MALIICSECGKEFSDKAPACPNCGCPTHNIVYSSRDSFSDILLSLKGVNGQVELYHNKIVIRRKGFIAKMGSGLFKGDKEIFLDQISAVQLKKASALISGYIQFTIPGGNEKLKGIFEATDDENTVMFRKDQNKVAEEIKNMIYQLR